MEFVYRYIDKADGIIKYCGRTSNLNLRIKQHSYEKQFMENDWEIEYIECMSRAHSEALESHFITLYGTYDWLNKAKNNWGLIPEFKNKEYEWNHYECKDTNKHLIKRVLNRKNKNSPILYARRGTLRTEGIYDLLLNCRNAIISSINNPKQHWAIIINSKPPLIDIYNYIRFISIYNGKNFYTLDVIPNECDNSINISEMDGDNTYQFIRFSNGSIIHFYLNFSRKYSYGFWKYYSKFHKQGVSPTVDYLICASNPNLIWETDYICTPDLPAFAIPVNTKIKENPMVGEVVFDKNAKKCFKRWYGNHDIVPVAFGVSHIFPYGKTKDDYATC